MQQNNSKFHESLQIISYQSSPARVPQSKNTIASQFSRVHISFPASSSQKPSLNVIIIWVNCQTTTIRGSYSPGTTPLVEYHIAQGTKHHGLLNSVDRTCWHNWIHLVNVPNFISLSSSTFALFSCSHFGSLSLGSTSVIMIIVSLLYWEYSIVWFFISIIVFYLIDLSRFNHKIRSLSIAHV